MDKITALLILFVCPLLLGTWAWEKRRWYEKYNRGAGILLFVIGVLKLIGQFFLWKRDWYMIAFLCCIVFAGIVYILVFSRKKQERVLAPEELKVTVVFLVVLVFVGLLQMQGYLFREVANGGDITVKAVNTMVSNSEFYQLNPYNGLPDTNGVYQNEYTAMGIFYMIICKMSGVQAAMLIHFLVPFWVLTTCGSIWYEFGRKFWKSHRSAGLFVCTVVFFNLFARGQQWLAVDGLLFEAWKDETILFVFLVPIIQLQIFEVCIEKRRKEFICLGLCLAAVYALQPVGKLYFAILLLITVIILLNGNEKIWVHLKH